MKILSAVRLARSSCSIRPGLGLGLSSALLLSFSACSNDDYDEAGILNDQGPGELSSFDLDTVLNDPTTADTSAVLAQFREEESTEWSTPGSVASARCRVPLIRVDYR